MFWNIICRVIYYLWEQIKTPIYLNCEVLLKLLKSKILFFHELHRTIFFKRLPITDYLFLQSFTSICNLCITMMWWCYNIILTKKVIKMCSWAIPSLKPKDPYIAYWLIHHLLIIICQNIVLFCLNIKYVLTKHHAAARYSVISIIFHSFAFVFFKYSIFY